MNVIYLDLNIAIELAEKRPRCGRAREAILDLVDRRSAIFPYSEIHHAECSTMYPDPLSTMTTEVVHA